MTIKQLRIKQRLSREEFAKEINVSKATVIKWEQGGGISLKNIAKIEKRFNVRLDF